jgi:hypothetical protein
MVPNLFLSLVIDVTSIESDLDKQIHVFVPVAKSKRKNDERPTTNMNVLNDVSSIDGMAGQTIHVFTHAYHVTIHF